MTPGDWRDTLSQILENTRRCGVARVPHGDALNECVGVILKELASRLDATVADRAGAAPAQPRSTPQASTSQPSASQPSASRAANESREQAAPAAPLGGESGWSLPRLDDTERQRRFDALILEAQGCRKCEGIVQHRRQIVFGEGPIRPLLCFLGEAPGAEEDRLGRPFVGRAGQLLTKIIEAMKMRREDVYILNALKCRPPQNRTPVQEEIGNCRHFVESQLDILGPRYIVCLGAVAARCLLGTEQSIGSQRGRFHSYRGARVVVTYHPSYLLRNESAKRLVWEDMKMLMRDMQESFPNGARS